MVEGKGVSARSRHVQRNTRREAVEYPLMAEPQVVPPQLDRPEMSVNPILRSAW